MDSFKGFSSIKNVQKIAKVRKTAVYLVGGFLRDFLLGKVSLDFDFALDRGALEFAEIFSNTIKGVYVLLDKERRCARVVKNIRGEIYTFDFAEFRAKSFIEDLEHRDFTINTFSIKISEMDLSLNIAECIDDLMCGAEDLEMRKIRMVSSAAFSEDPLRMMRAFSLEASLGFSIERKTLVQIKKDRDLIRNVSFERISVELFKIFESRKSDDLIKDMDSFGLLEKIIPQIKGMHKCKQGAYHHLDVWAHSLETIVQLEIVLQEFEDNEDMFHYLNEELGGGRSRRAIVKFAALLHDIGKPDTRKIEKGKYSFHSHEWVGRKIVRSIARMLKISTKERHAIEDMVNLHLRPGYLSNYEHPTERSIYRFFRDSKEEAVSILLLSLADQRATRGSLSTDSHQKHHQDICVRLINEFFVKKKEKPFVRLINGNDLKKYLKLSPSVIIGKILSEVEEAQILGKIKTKTQAKSFAKKIYGNANYTQ